MQAPMATEDEIQREMDSIRSMKRISSQSGPGSLALDPDLPAQSLSGSSSSSNAVRLSPNSHYANLPGISGLNHPVTGGTGDLVPPPIGDDDLVISGNTGGSFFWVPASLHPELAPSEFKVFLRDQLRDVEGGGDDGQISAAGLGRVGSIGLRRSSSGLSRSSSGLGRRGSMLSRQYQPKEGEDDVDEKSEDIKPMRRRSVYANAEPQLTIKDLQKLDDLADAAAAGKGGEANLIRRQLRRSISLGLAQGSSIGSSIETVPEDEENAPVIVPAKALTRTARTRIRKPGLEGDGNGHRFAASKRGKRGKTMDASMPHSAFDEAGRPESDMAVSDRGSLSDQEGEPYQRPQAPSPDALDDPDATTRPRFAGREEERPVSQAESFYDAYTGDSQDNTYYDARESATYEPEEPKRVTSAGSYDRGGALFDTTDDDEPFFAGAPPHNETVVGMSLQPVSAPTVVLRTHSPEHTAEQLPLGQRSPPQEKRSVDMTPSSYRRGGSAVPSFVKEHGYQAQYGQSPPASQVPQLQQPQPQQSVGIQHPTPKKHLDVPPTSQQSISPPSSPELVRSPSVSPSAELPSPYVRPYSAPPATSERPSSADKKAEKEKKRGLFGWGGGKDKEKEKDKDKDKKDKETLKKQKKDKAEAKVATKEEKESGGGLFGLFGGKKKHEDPSSNSSNAHSNAPQARNAGPKGQIMMFGATPPTLPGQYARYPLHVERAVYRLSHIKLANPRRPLYEQVLISNLMFWYLGIINKPATPPVEQNKLLPQGTDGTSPAPQNGPNQPANANGQPVAMSPAQQAAVAQATATAAAAETARLEQEQREKEQKQREEREAREREMQERERRERDQREHLERMDLERAEKEREKAAKKAGLTKGDREGRTRKAETPVRTLNYDVQSRTMDGNYAWEQDRAKGSSRPSTAPSSSSRSQPSSPQPTAYHLPVRVQQQRGGNGPQQPYFHQQDMNQVKYQPINPYALPPGAKPPAQVENSWAVNSSAAAGLESSRRSPPPNQQQSGDRPRPSRSPPPQDYLSNGTGGRPTRSLSATASGGASSSQPGRQEYDRPPHQYSQSTDRGLDLLNGGQQPQASSGPSRLQKKKSTGNVSPPPGDSTVPASRRRRSTEASAGDRRGIVEPDLSFSMWQQYQSQLGGYNQQPVASGTPPPSQGQQGYTSYR